MKSFFYIIIFCLIKIASSLANTPCSEKEHITDYYRENSLPFLSENDSDYFNRDLSDAHHTYIKEVVRDGCASLKDLTLSQKEFDTHETNYFEKRISKLKKDISLKAPFRSIEKEVKYLKELTDEKPEYKEGLEIFIPTMKQLNKTSQKSLDLYLKKKRCGGIDLRDESIKEVGDQDSLGWCFTWSASDFTSYFLNKKTSALHTTILYFQSRGVPLRKSIGRTGFAGSAVQISLIQGVCSEEDVPSENFHFSENGNDFIRKIKPMMRTLEHLNKNWKKSKRTKLSQVTCEERKTVQTLFPTVSPLDIFAALDRISTQGMINFLSIQSCKKNKLKNKELASRVKTKLVSHNVKEKKELLALIDSNLEKPFENKKGRVVGIFYNSRTLYDPELVSDIVNHTGIVVARRFNPIKKECQYLIKNTWGKSFDPPAHDSEDGFIWLGAKTLMSNVKGAIYVD